VCNRNSTYIFTIMRKYSLKDIIEMSLEQGATISDIEHLQKIKNAEENWNNSDRRATKEVISSSVNSNQPNKHKNQDKDNEKILSIYDSKYYSVLAEKRFEKLNSSAGHGAFKSFELFAQYCVWQDNTELSSAESKALNSIINDIKVQIKRMFPKVTSVNYAIHTSNKYNLFVAIKGISIYSFAFADLLIDLRISRRCLSIPTKQAIKLLCEETNQVKHLYNHKNRKDAKLV